MKKKIEKKAFQGVTKPAINTLDQYPPDIVSKVEKETVELLERLFSEANQ